MKTNAVASKEGTEDNPSPMSFEDVAPSNAGTQAGLHLHRHEDGSDEDQGFDTDESGTSAYSLGAGTEGTIDPANYIELPSQACRHLYHLTAKKGGRSKRVPVACGRSPCRLRGHEGSLSRQAVGYYIRQPKGETVHGRVDYPCLSREEFRQAVERSKQDTAQDIAEEQAKLPLQETQDPSENESSDEEDEIAANRAKVAFDLAATTTHAEPPRRPRAPALTMDVPDLETNEVARRAVERSPTSGAHRFAGFPRLNTEVDRVPGGGRNKKAATPWFGLIDRDGDKLVTGDPTDAEKCLRDKFRLMDVFGTQKKARAWRDAPGPPVETVASSDEEEAEAALLAASSRKKTPPPPRIHQIPSRSNPTVDGAHRTGYGLTLQEKRTLCWDLPQLRLLEKKGWKVTAVFGDEMEATEWLLEETPPTPPKKRSPRRSEKRKDDPSSSEESSVSADRDDGSSPSEGSSAESSSDSSDDESRGGSSGGNRGRRKPRSRKDRRRRRSKKAEKKKSRRRPRRTRTTTRPAPYGPDPSLGDPDRIFGVPIDREAKLGKLLGPGDLDRKSDRKQLAECMIDVGSLPGAYKQNQDSDEHGEVMGFIEGTAQLLGQTFGRQIKVDSQWRQAKRASLSKVKTQGDVEQLIDDIREVRDIVFKQQKQRIKALLHTCRYSPEEIDEYMYSGLWIRLILDTFDLNLRLLDTLLTTAREHGRFEGGLAEAMLKHHAGKLWNIRAYSENYQDLLLSVYVYYREAASSKYYHTSMMSSLWKRAASSKGGLPSSTSPPNSSTTTEEKGGKSTRTTTTGCSLCYSKGLHDLVKVGYGAELCPFQGKLNRAKAKKAAKELLERHKADNSIDLQVHLAEVVVAQQTT